MRRALYIAALLPLTLVSASGAAQLSLPDGIGLPDVGAPVERVVGALPLADIAALPPAQAARALLNARLDRLTRLVRSNPQDIEFDDRKYRQLIRGGFNFEL